MSTAIMIRLPDSFPVHKLLNSFNQVIKQNKHRYSSNKLDQDGVDTYIIEVAK